MKSLNSLLLIFGIILSTSVRPADIEEGSSSSVREMVEVDSKGKKLAVEEEEKRAEFIEIEEDFEFLPERNAIRAGREGAINDAEILWARILCSENCPVVTKDIKKKLWLLSTSRPKRYLFNCCGLIAFSTGIAVALSVGALQYFGALGPEESCSVDGTFIGDEKFISLKEFDDYVDCQQGNYEGWGRPNNVANLAASLIVVGLGSIAFNELLACRETEKNGVQDALNALRTMYGDIAASVLHEWTSKVKAIRDDRVAMREITRIVGEGADSLSPQTLDRLYTTTQGALLPRDITFRQIDELINNYDVIEAKLAMILHNDRLRAQEILFPLKELAEFLRLNDDVYDKTLLILALDPNGQIFGDGAYNRHNVIARLIKDKKLTNEALKRIIYSL